MDYILDAVAIGVTLGIIITIPTCAIKMESHDHEYKMKKLEMSCE